VDPALEQLRRDRSPDALAEAIIRREPAAALPDFVHVVAEFGDVATCRLRIDDIVRVRARPGVISLKAPRFLSSCAPIEEDEALDLLSEGTRVNSSGGGAGVVVAFLDFGFDFAHPNFRNADGSTRLIGLFDQRGYDESSPTTYGYGRIHSREDLDRALASDDPYAAIGYRPQDSDRGRGAHGTHTLDIAAGNGLLEGSVPGLAPDCELLCVHVSTGGTKGLADLGDSVRLLEALDWVRGSAGGRPFVVNMSLGTTGGDHTGTSLVERAMDALLREAPGRAIVQSTGNYYAHRTHADGQVAPGGSASLDWVVDAADRTGNELEIFYSARDRFRVEIVDPDGYATTVALGTHHAIPHRGLEVGRLYHRESDPQTGDHHIDILLDKDAAPGLWQVVLSAEDVVDGRYHGWIERDGGSPTNQSRFPDERASPRYTTGSVANGFLPLVTGAFDARTEARPLAPFSSSGPTRDGRQKPDLLAPGAAIRAARSTPEGHAPGSGGTTVFSGTSMAAPWVTGCVAQLFARAPRKLSIAETRALVLGSAEAAPTLDPLRSGYGYLDVTKLAAMPLPDTPPEIGRVTEDDTMVDEKTEQSPQAGAVADTIEVDRSVHDEAERTPKKRNMVLISGGPGPYDTRDVEHDRSWANYVTPPLLMTNRLSSRAQPLVEDDEEVWWFVYRPAYERRWREDRRSNEPDRNKAVREVLGKGFHSYVDMVERRAQEPHRRWNLRWLDQADDLWTKLASFSDPISRVWYWGHARYDLWLSLRHGSGGGPIAPEPDAIVQAEDISSNRALRSKFEAGSPRRVHRFIGCNTDRFAKAWARAFGVWTEGVDGYVHFCSIHRDPGAEVCLSQKEGSYAKVRHYDADGCPASLGTVRVAMSICNRTLCPSAAAPGASRGAGLGSGGEWTREGIILAAPHDVLPALGVGDQLIRQLPGGGRHFAVLTAGRVFSIDEARAEAVQTESNRQGLYAEIAEGGAFPHRADARFARRLTDGHGRLMPDQWLVRPSAYGLPAAEADAAGEVGESATRIQVPIATTGGLHVRRELDLLKDAIDGYWRSFRAGLKSFETDVSWPSVQAGRPKFFENALREVGKEVFSQAIGAMSKSSPVLAVIAKTLTGIVVAWDKEMELAAASRGERQLADYINNLRSAASRLHRQMRRRVDDVSPDVMTEFRRAVATSIRGQGRHGTFTGRAQMFLQELRAGVRDFEARTPQHSRFQQLLTERFARGEPWTRSIAHGGRVGGTLHLNIHVLREPGGGSVRWTVKSKAKDLVWSLATTAPCPENLATSLMRSLQDQGKPMWRTGLPKMVHLKIETEIPWSLNHYKTGAVRFTNDPRRGKIHVIGFPDQFRAAWRIPEIRNRALRVKLIEGSNK